MQNLTKDESFILTHALKGGQAEVIRNTWCAYPGEASIVSLIEKGYLLNGGSVNGPYDRTFCPGLHRFTVTEEGAKAVGLNLPSEQVLAAYERRMDELNRKHR